MRRTVLALAATLIVGCGTEPPEPRVEDALYEERLEALGGCTGYLFPDSLCEGRVESDAELVMWFAQTWTASSTCRDLYWSRGAYCQAESEMDVSCDDAEAAFDRALERLDGCADQAPMDCTRAECGDAVWWESLWSNAPSCDLLYWSHGAYCALPD